MRNVVMACLVGASLGVTALVSAQDPPEKSRTFCDPTGNAKCPGGAGPDCPCTPDTMEVTFDGLTDSVFEYATFTPNAPVGTFIVTDTKSVKVQGWSYGVDHDDAFLTLTNVTVDGTDAERAKTGGFVVADLVDIDTCLPADTKCANPVPASGYISAIIIHLTKAAELAPQRNKILKADYTLKADAGGGGTLIVITDKLKKRNSPTTDINLTIDGKSKAPVTIVDGWVKSGVVVGVEDCDNGTDDDGDGLVDCLDTVDCATAPNCPQGPETNCTDGIDNDGDGNADCLDTDCQGTPACPAPTCKDYALYFGPTAGTANHAIAGGSYVITMRNIADSLGFQLGVKKTTAGANATYEFSGALGADANRLIELIITDDKGDSNIPEAGNKATGPAADAVSDITRGTAIAGFARDFFAFDLAPGVGGPGFTVGYVADTNPPQGAGNKIPDTPAGAACPVNEILKVSFGGPVRFSRGDADGNSKINVADAILIIQNIVGNLAKRFACDDILDANDNGSLNVTDAIPVLTYVFQRGPDLPPPFKVCGEDPSADALPCTQPNCQ